MNGVDSGLAIDTIMKVTGGGAVGVLTYWLYLVLNGKLRAQKEVDAALASKDAENTWLHEQLAKEREYSKQLVSEMQEQNDSIRETFPALTAILQHALAERAGQRG